MEVWENGGLDARLVFVYDAGIVWRVFIFAGSGLVLWRQPVDVVISQPCQKC